MSCFLSFKRNRIKSPVNSLMVIPSWCFLVLHPSPAEVPCWMTPSYAVFYSSTPTQVTANRKNAIKKKTGQSISPWISEYRILYNLSAKQIRYPVVFVQIHPVVFRWNSPSAYQSSVKKTPVFFWVKSAHVFHPKLSKGEATSIWGSYFQLLVTSPSIFAPNMDVGQNGRARGPQMLV